MAPLLRNQITEVWRGRRDVPSKIPNNIELKLSSFENKTNKQLQQHYKWEIVWQNVFIIGGIHILFIYATYVRWTIDIPITAVILCRLLGLSSVFGITAGAHRLWTHRSYKANFGLQCFLIFAATLVYENSIYIWARDHRLHHKCSETDGDPHNAKRGFFFAHVGWLFVRKHPEVIRQGKSIDMSDLEANPVVMFQHKYYYPLVLLGTLFLPWAIGVFSGMHWMDAFVACVIYKLVIGLNVTWCINSVAHFYGHKLYDKNISPTESTIVTIFAGGEGFHNYHHTFPQDYKTAEFGNDGRNITTYFIDFCAWMGWASDCVTTSSEVINKRCERTGPEGWQLYKENDVKYRKLWHWHLLHVFLFLAFYGLA